MKPEIERAITAAGGPKSIAAECGITYQAVLHWMVRGLPRTEWTGETKYCAAIEKLTKGKFTKSELLKRE